MRDVHLSHRGRCAVAGIGASEFSKSSGRSPRTMAIQATLAALADAGLAVDDVDGLVQGDHDRVPTTTSPRRSGSRT
jgi:acetyl-CoA acetyltransferase